MQRKNNLLKTTHRKGFAMLMAIAMVVIISTLLALSISMTTQTAKRTTDIYLYEQAILYSKSAAELALLDISQAAPCTVTAKNYQFPAACSGSGCIYDANVTIRYVYKGLVCGSGNDYITTLQTDEQNGSVLMDITVTSSEGTEPIRYFRRSIQKL